MKARRKRREGGGQRHDKNAIPGPFGQAAAAHAVKATRVRGAAGIGVRVGTPVRLPIMGTTRATADIEPVSRIRVEHDGGSKGEGDEAARPRTQVVAATDREEIARTTI